MAQTRFARAAHWSDTPLARLVSPMQRFIHGEASSGIVLIGATLLALALANSPLAGWYDDVLHLEAGIVFGPLELRESLLHWINDGLMALFFFLVGLELKREFIAGELASPRQAALPLIAAVGGAAVPALIYTLLNRGGAGAPGWGIPMATDIAFALGVLALLGDRVPWGLKVFLTAVAVIDDLLAVVVIALFYTSGINTLALGVGVAVLALLLLLNWWGVRATLVYCLLGAVVWVAFLESGVHATIAGVLVALTVPARNRINAADFLARAQHILGHFAESSSAGDRMLTDERQQSAVLELEGAAEEVQAPLQKLEHQLQPWVAFGIVPVFALANAGVALSFAEGGATLPVTLGVMVGLVLGKPVGLFLTTWLVVRSGLAALPEGVGWAHIAAVGCLAGLGFTMSLFIATLGLADPALLEAAKLGILGGSLIAGLGGFGLLWRATRGAAPAQAEA